MEIEITHIEKGMVLMNFTTSLSANMGTFGIIATILAIIATVAAFILVVPESKREKLGRFGKFLHDAVNF